MRLLAALLAFALPSVSSATAMVMTFTGTPWNDPFTYKEWTENGLTATGSIGYWGDPDTAYLGRVGTMFENRMTFTTGDLFAPESLLLRPFGSGYCSTDPDCYDSKWDDPIPYIWFSGYLDGALVSTMGIYRPMSTEYELIDLSWIGIVDMFVVEVRSAADLGIGLCLGVKSCGEINIDDVTVHSVPEPGMLALLLCGLVGAVRLRRS